MSSKTAHDIEVELMSEREAGEVFDGIVRRELGISGAEFLRRWCAGDYASTDVDDLDGSPRSSPLSPWCDSRTPKLIQRVGRNVGR